MTKIAVFASGRGSNFKTVHTNVENGVISGDISLLITDNDEAGALQFAREKNIPFRIIKPKDFASPEAFGEELLQHLHKFAIDLIVLAGYLKKIPSNLINAYSARIVNIHPALLPAFGGKGMYGKRVHQAVFNSGAKVSGVTVHLVTDEYDAGPIVLQRAVDISDCQSPEEIAEKVLAEEHQTYPLAINLLIENEIVVEGQRVLIGNKKS